MSKRAIETAYLMWGDRYAGPDAFRELARAVQDSGVVDFIMAPDQYGNFIPRCLWTPEHTPMAAALPDPDSLMDGVAAAGLALGAAPDLGVILSTDANRRGPIEFAQMAVTLAEITKGKAHVWVGSGELKNIRPLGYKRQGLGKMEDIFQVFNRLWNDPSPLDFEGNHWKLSGATIGDQRRHRPKIWGMGEGPRLFDIATSHADGLGSVIPLKFQTPEDCQERIDLARKAVAEKGRDPEKFELGMDLFLLCHPDENVVDRALESAPVKWMSALMGRIGADNWRKDGLESPVPDDWTYFAKYITTQTSDAFVEETLAKTSRKHVEASWIYGTPDQVERQLEGFLETDLSLYTMLNYVPMTVGPEQAAGAFAADMDLCGRIKARASALV
jgi:phthiodiolone/phenolphthiodiolone dimycocerosates ketoreductase